MSKQGVAEGKQYASEKHHYTIDGTKVVIRTLNDLYGQKVVSNKVSTKNFATPQDALDWVKNKIKSENIKQGVAEGSEDLAWHGSNTDMGWYDAYQDQPVRVKVKNHSGLSGNPSGTFNIRSFKKIGSTKAELTIRSRMEEMTGTVDLDNPETVVNKMYDRVPAMNFYVGRMPVTPRQAFNMFQHKNNPQDRTESKNND